MCTFAIGDIHGSFLTFMALLNKIKYDHKKDTLILMGDYIDKGGSSREVLEWLMLAETRGNLILLKGNHEDVFLKNIKDPELSFLESFPDRKIPSSIIDWMNKKFVLSYEDEKYLYVHAGVDIDKPLEEQTDIDLMYTKGDFLSKEHSIPKPVVFGHTSVVHPQKMKNNIIPIDSGCVYGHKLSALNVDTNEIVCYNCIDKRWTSKTNNIKYQVFNKLINEDKYNLEIGWWLDQPTVKLYHGTSFHNLESIFEKGLIVTNQEFTYLSLDPNTARGYSIFRNGHTAGNKLNASPKERVILEIEIKVSNLLEIMLDINFVNRYSYGRLKDKINYQNSNLTDLEYYKYTEIHINKTIPPEKIKVFGGN